MSVPPQPPAHSPPQNNLPPLNFEDTPVEDLEQLRPRLTQLTHSLRKLEESLRTLHYTPSSTTDLTAIQNQFNVVLQQLASLSKTLQSHRETLQVTTVFPNREFNTMSGLLFNLLRKKLTPEVEDWIQHAKDVATESQTPLLPPSTANSIITQTTVNTAAATTNSTPKINDSHSLETLLFKDDQLTDELAEYAHSALEDYMFGGYLTKAEIDSGLKITDVLQNVKREELESPVSSPSPSSSISSSSDVSPPQPLAETDLLKFIYQGLDSNIYL